MKVEFEFDENMVRDIELAKKAIVEYVANLFGKAEVLFTTEEEKRVGICGDFKVCKTEDEFFGPAIEELGRKLKNERIRKEAKK